MTPMAICPKCGKEYRMGYNGTVNGCDECLGIERDGQGRAWHPGEIEKTEEKYHGIQVTLFRADVFTGREL